MSDELIVKFIVSEDIETHSITPNETKNIVINPILVMRTQYIPTSLSLALTVLVSGIDFTKENSIKIDLINDEKNNMVYTTGLTKIPANEVQEVDNFSFNLELRNVAFENEGMYKFIFEINGKEFTDRFRVVEIVS